MAATLLRSAPELRELFRGASRLLQHPQHRRIVQGQVHAGRLRLPAGRVLLPPAVPAQRAEVLGGAGRPGQAGQQRPDARHRRLRDVRGGPPLRFLGVSHEPLQHLHHPPLLWQREAAAGLPRHAPWNLQLHSHAHSWDHQRTHGAVHVIAHPSSVMFTFQFVCFGQGDTSLYQKRELAFGAHTCLHSGAVSFRCVPEGVYVANQITRVISDSVPRGCLFLMCKVVFIVMLFLWSFLVALL